jgi:hypothetical protein
VKGVAAFSTQSSLKTKRVKPSSQEGFILYTVLVESLVTKMLASLRAEAWGDEFNEFANR